MCINPLGPSHQISPYGINTPQTREVMRIEIMTTKDDSSGILTTFLYFSCEKKLLR